MFIYGFIMIPLPSIHNDNKKYILLWGIKESYILQGLSRCKDIKDKKGEEQ